LRETEEEFSNQITNLSDEESDDSSLGGLDESDHEESTADERFDY